MEPFAATSLRRALSDARLVRLGTPIATAFVHFGVVVGNEAPRRCVQCGRVPLLLLVFADGLIRRARVGCPCSSIRVYPNETERAMRARLARECKAALAKRPAS